MNGNISVTTATTKLKPGQKHQFQVQFHGMAPCALRFELSDYDSGTISGEGEYTAPDRAGSFEVRIFCAHDPDIGTYAYIEVEAAQAPAH